jgi:hypothetical protein
MSARATLPIDQTIYVDLLSMLAITKSLPSADLELNVEDSTLHWLCKDKNKSVARGKLALANPVKMTVAPSYEGKFIPVDAAWKRALDLGSLACAEGGQVRFTGIVLDNRDGLYVMSTDDITISTAKINDSSLKSCPPKLTFSPQSIALLCSVLKDGGKLGLEHDKGFYYIDPIYELYLPRTQEMSDDLRPVVDEFSGGEVSVPLMHDRISAFVKRVEALSENRQRLQIVLAINEGALTLSFAENAATSDEWYPVDLPKDVPDLPQISLDARRFTRALQHADEVVLDHLERKVLVLRSKDKMFQYIIEGRAA